MALEAFQGWSIFELYVLANRIRKGKMEFKYTALYSNSSGLFFFREQLKQ